MSSWWTVHCWCWRILDVDMLLPFGVGHFCFSGSLRFPASFFDLLLDLKISGRVFDDVAHLHFVAVLAQYDGGDDTCDDVQQFRHHFHLLLHPFLFFLFLLTLALLLAFSIVFAQACCWKAWRLARVRNKASSRSLSSATVVG